jgi:hypothetical protein
MTGRGGTWKLAQHLQYGGSLPDLDAGQFANNKWVGEYLLFIE